MFNSYKRQLDPVTTTTTIIEDDYTNDYSLQDYEGSAWEELGHNIQDPNIYHSKTKIDISKIKPDKSTTRSYNRKATINHNNHFRQVNGVSCGNTDNFNRIIGGTNITIVDAPWHVLVVAGDTESTGYLCGGVIISENFILTSAFCIEDTFAEFSGIGYGLTTIPEDLSIPSEKWRDAAKMELHFNYGIDFGKSINDIAYIELTQDVTFGIDAFPICLPSNKFCLKEGRKVTATGWGYNYEASFIEELNKNRQDGIEILNEAYKIDEFNQNEKTSSVDRLLLYIPLPSDIRTASPRIEKVNDCKWLWGIEDEEFVDQTYLCAGSDFEDACYGDIGGPLTWTDGSGISVLVGLTSLRVSCGYNVPTLYTRVNQYLEWIYDFTNGNVFPTNDKEPLYTCFDTSDTENLEEFLLPVEDEENIEEFTQDSNGVHNNITMQIFGRAFSEYSSITFPEPKNFCIRKQNIEKPFNQGNNLSHRPCERSLLFEFTHNTTSKAISTWGYSHEYCFDISNDRDFPVLKRCSENDIDQMWEWDSYTGILKHLGSDKVLQHSSKALDSMVMFRYVPTIWGETNYPSINGPFDPINDQLVARTGTKEFIKNIAGFDESKHYCVRSDSYKKYARIFLTVCRTDKKDTDRTKWKIGQDFKKPGPNPREKRGYFGRIRSTTKIKKRNKWCWMAHKLNKPSDLVLYPCSKAKNKRGQTDFEYDRNTGYIYLKHRVNVKKPKNSVSSKKWCVTTTRTNGKMKVVECKHVSFGRTV